MADKRPTIARLNPVVLGDKRRVSMEMTIDNLPTTFSNVMLTMPDMLGEFEQFVKNIFNMSNYFSTTLHAVKNILPNWPALPVTSFYSIFFLSFGLRMY